MHAVSYAVFILLAFPASKYGPRPNAEKVHLEFDQGDSLAVLGAPFEVNVEHANIWLQALEKAVILAVNKVIVAIDHFGRVLNPLRIFLVQKNLSAKFLQVRTQAFAQREICQRLQSGQICTLIQSTASALRHHGRKGDHELTRTRKGGDLTTMWTAWSTPFFVVACKGIEVNMKLKIQAMQKFGFITSSNLRKRRTIAVLWAVHSLP